MELDLIKNSAFNNCSSIESKIIALNQVILKYENEFNNVESNKEYVINHHKRFYNKNHIFRPTCFLCKEKVHTTNACYIRNYGIPCSEHVWMRKVFNQKGPIENWVPRCN